MKKMTITSTKCNYQVYPNNDGSAYLVVNRRDDMHYHITEDGTVTYNENGYSFLKDKEDEIYYLDYVSLKVIQKIEVLTENYNYKEILLCLDSLKKEIQNFKLENFSMDHHDLFETILDSLDQLFEFTQENIYYGKKEELKLIFDQYFYNRITPWSKEEKNHLEETISDLMLFYIKNIKDLDSSH